MLERICLGKGKVAVKKIIGFDKVDYPTSSLQFSKVFFTNAMN